MPKTTIIAIDGLRIEVNYKPIKRLYLRVHTPDGRISVTAPRQLSIKDITQFIQTKVAWIHQKRTAIVNTTPIAAPDTSHAWVWGVQYPIDVTHGPRAQVVLTPTHLMVTVPATSTPGQHAAILQRWYHQQVQAALPALVANWSMRMGVQVNKIFVQQMKTRWGSCNYRAGHIRLNSALAQYPPHLLEYVVVHELVHLLEPSHNARFYTLMGQFWPQWKDDREVLKRGLG
jgi:predicted metal-dependent hydrolase